MKNGRHPFEEWRPFFCSARLTALNSGRTGGTSYGFSCLMYARMNFPRGVELLGQGIQRKPFPGVLFVRLHHPGLSRVSPGDYLEGYKMFMGLDIVDRAEDLEVPNCQAGFLPDLRAAPSKNRFVVFLLAPAVITSCPVRKCRRCLARLQRDAPKGSCFLLGSLPQCPLL